MSILTNRTSNLAEEGERMQNPKVLTIIPAYNEEGSLAVLISATR